MVLDASLTLAEHSDRVTPDQVADLLNVKYGLTHDGTIEKLTPRVVATTYAMQGHHHDPNHVDPVAAHRMRHTLALDGRAVTRASDIPWDLGRIEDRRRRHQDY